MVRKAILFVIGGILLRPSLENFLGKTLPDQNFRTFLAVLIIGIGLWMTYKERGLKW